MSEPTKAAWSLEPNAIGWWVFVPCVRSTLTPLETYEFERVISASEDRLRCESSLPEHPGLWYGPTLPGRADGELWSKAQAR